MSNPFAMPADGGLTYPQGFAGQAANAVADRIIGGWIPPVSSVIQQLQVGVDAAIVAGTITVKISVLDMDNLAAGWVDEAEVILDSDHESEAWVGAITVTPRTQVAIRVTGAALNPTPSNVIGSFLALLGAV